MHLDLKFPVVANRKSVTLISGMLVKEEVAHESSLSCYKITAMLPAYYCWIGAIQRISIQIAGTADPIYRYYAPLLQYTFWEEEMGERRLRFKGIRSLSFRGF